MNKRYLFIINTDKYAGNFEREMCAYSTGQIGDCEVGHRQADDFLDEYGEDVVNEFGDKIMQVADEHGCYRPCEIYNNNIETNNEYHAVCISFNQPPTSHMIHIMRGMSIEYGVMKGINVLSFELLLEETSVITTEIASFNTKF